MNDQPWRAFVARADDRRQNRGGTVEISQSAPNKPASAKVGAEPVCILQTIEPRVKSSAAKRAESFQARQGEAGRGREPV